MSAEMDSVGIIFDLQWKKKPRGNNRETFASIGIWDTPDASLDWLTFKSYVCQNLGTPENIHVTYLDSDGDEIPIESECEFEEALKFARRMSIKGRNVTLRLDKKGGPIIAASDNMSKQKKASEPKLFIDNENEKSLKKETEENVMEQEKPSEAKIMIVDEKILKKKTGKIIAKVKKGDIFPNFPQHTESFSSKLISNKVINKKIDETNKLVDDNIPQLTLGVTKKDGSVKQHLVKDSAKSVIKKSDPFSCPLSLHKMKVPKYSSASKKDYDTPPLWFLRFMDSFKKELSAEITANVITNTRRTLIASSRLNCNNTYCCSCGNQNITSSASSKSKKKSSDEDSSDGAQSRKQRLGKLLRKIEKLQKSEKKQEKKLDSELQKLENKTKKIIKKNLNKIVKDKPQNEKNKPNFNAASINPPSEVHIKVGEHYTHVWEVMNTGNQPWNDETELRLEWARGINPEDITVKCPITLPRKKAIISVNFHPCVSPSSFSSLWHFTQSGIEFGPKLTCSGSIYLFEIASIEPGIVESSLNPDQISMKSGSSFIEKPSQTTADINDITDEVIAEKIAEIDINDYQVEQINNESAGDANSISNLIEFDTYDNVDEEKRSVTERKKRDPEYDSDSDDDNLSIISGTISFSSDSDDNDTFVVVPMPACFICDVPLNSTDTVTELQKEDEEKPKNRENDRDATIDEQEIHNYGETISVQPSNSNMEIPTSVVSEELSWNYLKSVNEDSSSHDSVTESQKEDAEDSENRENDREVKNYSTLDKKENDNDGQSFNETVSVQPTNSNMEIPSSVASEELSINEDSSSHDKSPIKENLGNKEDDAKSFESNTVYAIDTKGICLPCYRMRSGISNANNNCDFSSEMQDNYFSSADFSKSDSDTSTKRGEYSNSDTSTKGGLNSNSNTSVKRGQSSDYYTSARKEQKKQPKAEFKCHHVYSGAYSWIPSNKRDTLSGNSNINPENTSIPLPKRFNNPGCYGDRIPKSHRKNFKCKHSHGHTTPNFFTEHAKRHSQEHFSNHHASPPNMAPNISVNANHTSFSSQSTNTSQATSPNQPEDTFASSVHILPETLMNGAINVASQAYTKARTVLSSFRSRPSEHDEWYWNDGRPNEVHDRSTSTSESLNLLLEMGFTNKVLNVLLLERYDNDITRVVAELLTYKDNTGHNFSNHTQTDK